MSRMFDRTQSVAQGFEPPWWADRSLDNNFRRMRDKLLPVLRGAQVFSIDNVCEYCYTSIEKEYWTLGDFPNLAPPFPSFFMEMRSPRHVLTPVDGRMRLAPTEYDFAGWGVLVIGTENAQLNAIRRSLSLNPSNRVMAGAQHLPESAEPQSVSEADVPRWHLMALLFVENGAGTLSLPFSPGSSMSTPPARRQAT